MINVIKLDNYNFEGPYLLSTFEGLNRAAIYAILCKNIFSNDFKIIYIGQSGEYGARLDTHNKKYCWDDNCKAGILYVAIFYTPTDQYSKKEREKLEGELISKFNPVCNEKNKNNLLETIKSVIK